MTITCLARGLTISLECRGEKKRGEKSSLEISALILEWHSAVLLLQALNLETSELTKKINLFFLLAFYNLIVINLSRLHLSAKLPYTYKTDDLVHILEPLHLI